MANPSGYAKNVEINTGDPGRSYCSAERNDSKIRSGGQNIYLAGCVAGTGTVDIRRSSDNTLLRRYTFNISSAGAATPTPTATQAPQTDEHAQSHLSTDIDLDANRYRDAYANSDRCANTYKHGCAHSNPWMFSDRLGQLGLLQSDSAAHYHSNI